MFSTCTDPHSSATGQSIGRTALTPLGMTHIGVREFRGANGFASLLSLDLKDGLDAGSTRLLP